ncbi:MAG TPA: acetyl-CoA C-acetyltransferase [Allosphingosinicella sp.]|nr:acetyl-CoA C-acetyltransferase [Allosphingosinicella sp.]
MSAEDPIVILSYARTPMGSFQGSLAGASATELGAAAVGAAVERAGVKPEDVEKIYMGCVLPAGLGQAPARQAAIKAGLGTHIEATTVNKMCGSGMQAAIMAADTISAGSADIVIAGGMESMTNAPYFLPKHRGGARIGHDRIVDHMFFDGLEDAYEQGRLMGSFAEEAAQDYQFTREAQDDYAIASLTRAQKAQAEGWFAREITPVEIAGRKGAVTIAEDEQPGKGDAAKIPTLKPVARIVAHAAHAHEPAKFTTAPVGAMTKALKLAGWDASEVDLYEVNEAFACVAMIAMRDLGIPHDKINVHGGATALGHPIGASGARVMATLLSALETHGGKKGVASLCIGGGEATAVAVELVD